MFPFSISKLVPEGYALVLRMCRSEEKSRHVASSVESSKEVKQTK